EQGGNAFARADPEWIAALRAHTAGAVDLGAVDDLLAGLAFDPESLGDHDLLRALLAGLALSPPEPGQGLGGGLRPPSEPPPDSDCAGQARARSGRSERHWGACARGNFRRQLETGQIAHTFGLPLVPANGAFSAAMKSPTVRSRSGEVACCSTSDTMAEPTMTPSAWRPTSAACSGVLIPNPTQTGLVVMLRSARRWSTRSLGSSLRMPVTPVSDTM